MTSDAKATPTPPTPADIKVPPADKRAKRRAAAASADAAPKAPDAPPAQPQQQPQQQPFDFERVRVELEDHVMMLTRCFQALAGARELMQQHGQLAQFRQIALPRLKAADDLMAGLNVLLSSKSKAIPTPILDTLQGLVSKYEKATKPPQQVNA